MSSRKRVPQASRRDGDSVSRKQLQRTVLDGRKVTMHIPSGAVHGYVCGMDAYHWMVVTPEGEKNLVHKSAAALVTLHDERTYEDEPQFSLLEQVVAPFRGYLLYQRNQSTS